MTDHREVCGNPNCAFCKNHLRFSMPEGIPEALKNGRLALFAGAGISTEARGVFPTTFYEDIAEEIGIEPASDLAFPILMSQFCRHRSRRELLIRIRQRFNYLESFPEVRRDASRFHRELATIPFLSEIYTTNWDEIFERECLATPFVSGEDYAFWDLPGRKVFKLHGSASHYGSIVATEEDDEACVARLKSGLIGSSLKLALATKTILFVGYSARDSDFIQVLDLVKEEVGSLAPPMYAVTLSENDQPRLEAMGITVIVTDATYFIGELKRSLVSERVMLDDSWRDDISDILDNVLDTHLEATKRFNCVDHPSIIYTFSYQDGLKHGLERLLSLSKSGECSDPNYLTGKLRAYEQEKAKRKRSRDYTNLAYLEGYSNALLLPLMPTEDRFGVPLYFAHGYKEPIADLEDLQMALLEGPHLHRGAYKRAQAIVKSRGNDPDIIFHHAPWL